MATEFIPLRNAIYVGNYGFAISKASNLSFENDSQKQLERDILLYRAQIGLGQIDLVYFELKDQTKLPTPLQGLKFLAQYLFQQDASERQSTVEEAEKFYGNEIHAKEDVTFVYCLSTIYSYENRHMDVLRIVNYNPQQHLEWHFLKVTHLLRIQRMDLALEALKKMQEVNDDATLTQLTNAYVCLQRGGKDKIQEALNIFQDLIEKYGGGGNASSSNQSSVILLNGMALCHLQLGQFEQAEKFLMNALAQRSNDVETLINLIVCAQHLKKSKDLIDRYVKQVKNLNKQQSQGSASTQWLQGLLELESKLF